MVEEALKYSEVDSLCEECDEYIYKDVCIYKEAKESV
jgi:hypothetical protein